MKNKGIIHPDLNYHISCLGHYDGFAICDAGLPIPSHIPRIDLAWKYQEPQFLPVIQGIFDEICIEYIVFAKEFYEHQSSLYLKTAQYLQMQAKLTDNAIKYISHEDFKQQLNQLKFIVRTGETTPYANIIIHSGVDF